MKPFAVADFETHAINGALPPEPVGVAILYPDNTKEYLAWGHLSGNNCTKEFARDILDNLFKNHAVIFHNAQFDIAVAKYWLGIEFPIELHDTLFLLYLKDPHAKTLSLKPSADAILGHKPQEQDLLHNWIINNVPKATKKDAGAYISKAPVELVAPYAIGDVVRTKELFDTLYAKYKGEAYERECKLCKILTDSTLRGIRLDYNKLSKDFEVYSQTRKDVDNRLFKKLGSAFNPDSSDELANALEKSGLDCNWVLTPTGKRSTSKPNLIKAINDEELLTLLAYRSTLSTYLESFYSSWIDKQKEGRLHFSWNQVRNQEQEKGGFMGTRTGRLSSVPSMLNVPGTPSYIDPKWGLPQLPYMRSYLHAEEDQVWLKRDYSQQELRVLAHYEDGALMEAFIKDPNLDMHTFMASELSKVLGYEVPRKTAKTIAFGILYGLGLAQMAIKLECAYNEAASIKNTYLNAVPGIKEVQQAIKQKWSSGLPIKTFGGRLYYKEESKLIVDKTTGLPRMQDFIYKGLNYLIQGSSADITKQAIINYYDIKKEGQFNIAVHDEINISGPVSEMKLLKEAMHDISLDVPLTSDGFIGDSYGILTTFE